MKNYAYLDDDNTVVSEPVLQNSKTYFDYFSDEYKSRNIDDKLLTLALFVNKYGDLRGAVSRYRNNKDVVHTSSLYDTLLFYIVYLRTGEYHNELESILRKFLNEGQLIDLLSEELKLRLEKDPALQGQSYKLSTYYTYNLDKYMAEYRASLNKIIYGEELVGKIDLFRDDKETLRVENPWLSIAKKIADNNYIIREDCVHSEDRRIVEEFNHITKDEYLLRLDLPPEPFQGNPLNAEVIILTLNPGFVEKCNVGMFEALSYEEKIDFIAAKCRTMSMQDELCVPDNDIINDIGEHYWERKLKSVLSFPEANKRIAIVQFLGYFSKKYKSIPKKLFHGEEALLYTQKYTIRLIRYLMQENKLLIIGRHIKMWYKYIPELERYPRKVLLNSYLQTAVSPGNCKEGDFELIKEALTE